MLILFYTVFQRFFYEWLIVYLETISAITDCCSFLLNHYNDEQKHLSLYNFYLQSHHRSSVTMALCTENPKPLIPLFFIWMNHQPQIRKSFFLYILGYLFQHLKKECHLEI